ncbi:MAG: twin-arginine translocation pathway signal protein [Pseudomonadota bacterium]
MPNRRNTLALIGGGLIAAAGTATYAVTRTPRTALAPWDMAGQYDDPRKRALSWAILSPNPHNRQPWMVDLGTPNEAHLYVDTNRLLPHTDPFNRQITIGLGCFLETLRMAAASEGIGTQTALFPQGSDPEKLDARPVAVVRFEGTATPDPLFAHVPHRRSQKEPFDTARPVPQATLDDLLGALRAETTCRVAGSVDPETIAAQRQLSEDAMMIELETDHTYKESVDLFRIGRAEVDANPDGIDFTGPMFETLHLTGQFTREAAMDRTSLAYTGGVDAVLENMRTAMGHFWLTTQGNTRQDQIAAGAAWMRANLHCQRLGLGTQPLSQALQEYPEMDALYAQAHETMARPGETIQMWARIGYSPEVAPSPRWPIEAKLVR